MEVRLDGAAPDGHAVPGLDLQAFLVRIEGDVHGVGTATNRGSSPAGITLLSATLAVFDPIKFYEKIENLPMSRGVLAPGESRSFGARFRDSIGPPGRAAALTLNGWLQWQGSPASFPTQIFSRDFNNLRLP